MSSMKKIFNIIILVVIEVLQLGLICILIIFYTRDKPFENIIPNGNPYTYSVGKTEFEIELEYNDALKLRKFLDEFSLITKTPNDIFNLGRHNILNVYMPNGEKHSIVFMGSKEVFGFPIGIVEYNSEEYVVEYWLYEYGELFCSPYYDKYMRWR